MHIMPFTSGPMELPADARFFYDFTAARNAHIDRMQDSLGKIATNRRAWMDTDWEPKPINFRGADHASTRVITLDDFGCLGFDLRLTRNNDGKIERITLPQDNTTQDEIFEAAQAFYGDGTEEELRLELEYDGPFYQVLAHPETLPIIVNWHMWGNTDDLRAFESRNASLLTPKECTELIRYLGTIAPTLTGFSLEFGCVSPGELGQVDQ